MSREDLLQKRLELLEAGESLQECLADLHPEEAELLRLAFTLRQAPVPVQEPDVVTAQRSRLVSLASKEGRLKPAVPTAVISRPWTSLHHWMQRRSAYDWTLVAGLVPAVAILIFALLVGGINSSAEVATIADAGRGESAVLESESDAATDTETPDVAAEPDNATATTTNDGEPANVVAEAPQTQIFIPTVANPLVHDAKTATVQEVQGLVEIQAEDGSWELVKRTGSLIAGQRVRTGTLSSATMVFYDGSQASIGPNTEISVDQLDALRPENGFRTVVMTQYLGESEHQVAFRNDAGSRYEVKTPTGSGIARGTIFQVLVTAEQTAHYSVEEGAVQVSNAGSSVLVRARQMTVFNADETPAAPSFFVTGEGELTGKGATWFIGGQEFSLSDSVIIIGDPQVGDTVFVRGRLLSGGTLVADLIVLLHSAPENHFTIVGEVDSIDNVLREWMVAGQTVAITDTTDIDADIIVGSLVRVRGIVEEDGDLLALDIDLIEVAAEGYPFEFTGVVEDIEMIGDEEIWTISGVMIKVDDDTEVDPDIDDGDGSLVKVEGYILDDGTWLADEIELIETLEARFVFTGIVENIDPWRVNGRDFLLDDHVEKDDGIDVGS
jgi:hypothetical protein